ncbi:MAG: hypothetical protein ACRENX_02905 [Candidatus Dormibacteria bacterium]
MTADHLQLIRSVAYTELVVDRVTSLHRGEASLLRVVHEADEGCCALESWETTWSRMMAMAAARRGLSPLVELGDVTVEGHRA